MAQSLDESQVNAAGAPEADDDSGDLIADLIACYGLHVTPELRQFFDSDPEGARAAVARWFRSC